MQTATLRSTIHTSLSVRVLLGSARSSGRRLAQGFAAVLFSGLWYGVRMGRRSSVAVGIVLTLGTAGCPFPVRHPPVVLSCDEGTVRPLSEVPESERPASIAVGLALMQDRWRAPVSALLSCPEQEDEEIVLTIVPPGADGLRVFSSPAALPAGAGYLCSYAASGDGLITIEGMTMDGAPVVVDRRPFAISISQESRPGTPVTGRLQMALSGRWNDLFVSQGFAADGQPFGTVVFQRTTMTGNMGEGEGMVCRMTFAP